MSLKRLLLSLVAMLALASGDTAWAGHCGACNYQRAPCLPEQVCMPTIRYRVCYQEVCEDRTCVCYRPVYTTVMKECRETVYQPVRETRLQEVRYTVCKPVWETYNVERRYKVCKPVLRHPHAGNPHDGVQDDPAVLPGTRVLDDLSAGVPESRQGSALHGVQAVLAGVPGAGQLDHLQARVRAARPRTALHGMP